MSRNKTQLAAAKKLLKKPKGPLLPIDLSRRNHPAWMTRAYRNNRYTVMIDDRATTPDGRKAVKAMIQKHDDKPLDRHWREIQAIKNELFGKEAMGVEYYPPESMLQDHHNIFWLWVIEGVDSE